MGPLNITKARLVILGNTQQEGIDFRETSWQHRYGPYPFDCCISSELVRSLDGRPQHFSLWGVEGGSVYASSSKFSTHFSWSSLQVKKSLYEFRQVFCCWFSKLASALVSAVILSLIRIVFSILTIRMKFFYMF